MNVLALLGIVIGIVAVPLRTFDADALAHFERLQHHIGRHIVVIDGTGLMMEGQLLDARTSIIEIGFGAQVRQLSAADIARVDRMKDSSIDGLVKGALIGVLLGALSHNAKWVMSSAAIYGGLGLGLDALHNAREPIYRARDAKALQLAATIRW